MPTGLDKYKWVERGEGVGRTPGPTPEPLIALTSGLTVPVPASGDQRERNGP